VLDANSMEEVARWRTPVDEGGRAPAVPFGFHGEFLH